MPGRGTRFIRESRTRERQRRYPRVAGTPRAVQCCAPTPARLPFHAATLPIATRAPGSPSPRRCSRASPASPPPLLPPPFAASFDPWTDHFGPFCQPSLPFPISSPHLDLGFRLSSRKIECRGREVGEIADSGTRVGLSERCRDFLAGDLCVSSCSLANF